MRPASVVRWHWREPLWLVPTAVLVIILSAGLALRLRRERRSGLAIGRMCMSPDGRRVALFAYDGLGRSGTFILELGARGARLLLPLLNEAPLSSFLYPLEWSRDGSELLMQHMWADDEGHTGIRVDRLRLSDLSLSDIRPKLPGLWTGALWTPTSSEVVLRGLYPGRRDKRGRRVPFAVYVSRRGSSTPTRLVVGHPLGVARRKGGGYWVFFYRYTDAGDAADANANLWVVAYPPERPREIVSWAWDRCAVSPDGKTLALTRGSRCWLGGQHTDVALLRWQSGASVKVAHIPGPSAAVRWSPKGGRLACLTLDGLWVYDVRTRNCRLCAGAGAGGPYGCLAWMPDGEHVVVTRAGRLILVDVESGNAKTLLDLNGKGWAEEAVSAMRKRWGTAPSPR